MNKAGTNKIQFYDYHPQPADMVHEVLNGMRADQKWIPPKFFYDHEGSRLFERICELPEYYLTRTEVGLLEEHAEEIAALIGQKCLLIEPGSGSSQKVRLLLESLKPRAYMPMEISREFLRDAAENLAAEYPWLDVHATCIDFTADLHLPYCPSGTHRVAFFPGSTIGNYEPKAAIRLLDNIARLIGAGGGLLIGIDLKKDRQILEAAYDDQQGITAAFNFNLLKRINRELNANFDLTQFSYRAFYNHVASRVEMHLVSRQEQRVSIDDNEFILDEGESIHTENSYKYTIEEFQMLLQRANFIPVEFWTDKDELFSIHYFVLPKQ